MRVYASFEHTTAEIFSLRTIPLENEILDFWRKHEPKKIDRLLFRQGLKAALRQQAHALTNMQEVLEKQEHLPPSLAKMEAWRRLMHIEENAAQEAAAWGMTLDEYRNHTGSTA